MPHEKVLLDTDIGSDIDDAVCLAYLLANPECELLGVTTVSGEPDKRAELADALVRRAGRTVSIVPGAAEPILGPCRQPLAPQAKALTRWPHGAYAGDGSGFDAVRFMREVIRKHPGEITLLAVGPMTNLSLLFAADPAIPGMLKRLVLMCGEFKNVSGAGRGEWNAINDPIATARVYAARPPIHRSVGLNVTQKVVMPAEEVRERFARHALLQPVLDFAEVWFRHAKSITFHDPLAAVSIFDEGVCSWQKARVEPELQGRAEGVTWAVNDDQGPHEIAVSVEPERFFKQYFAVFG